MILFSKMSAIHSTLFHVFNNDLLAVISSNLRIYTEDANVYSCLSGKFDISDKVKLAVLEI